MTTTVLGGRGFIGRHLEATLRSRGIECWLPERGDPRIFQRPLGHIYYCIGLTADFRERPYNTVDAHIGVLRDILEYADFDQLLYLSSTRVYSGSCSATETQTLSVAPFRADDLYNVSKLMGESLALSCGRPCKVIRLSNVLGPDMGSTNFVGALVAEARATGRIFLRSAPSSQKDYIWIDDVVNGLISIAEKGRHSLYNLAGGENISHAAILELLTAKGIEVAIIDNAPTTVFPTISIERLTADIEFHPAPILPRLSAWLDSVLAPP